MDRQFRVREEGSHWLVEARWVRKESTHTTTNITYWAWETIAKGGKKKEVIEAFMKRTALNMEPLYEDPDWPEQHKILCRLEELAEELVMEPYDFRKEGNKNEIGRLKNDLESLRHRLGLTGYPLPRMKEAQRHE